MVAPHLLVNVNNETNHNATLLCPDSFGSNKDMVGETSNHVDNNDDGQAINDDNNLNLSNIFVKNLALFYLKLNAQYHVPSSTVQKRIQEMQAMHSISQNDLKDHIRSTLTEFSVGEEVRSNI